MMERYIVSIPGHDPFQVALAPDEMDGGYVVECLDMEGCVSEGDTRESAIANIKDAIGGVCESMIAHHGRVIRSTDATYSGWPEEPYTNTTLEPAA